MTDEALLVGDIGGTHGRFAIAGEDLRPTLAGVEEGAAHQGFEEAVAAYLEKSGAKAKRAAFAVAGAVTDGRRAQITNRRNWIIDADLLEKRFGFDRVIVMNDFAGQAASLPHLAPDEVVPLGAAKARADAVKVALGPGTGLGVAALVPTKSEGWLPLQSEGGHVELAATNEREWAAFAVIRRERGRVEAEAVLSGPGLARLHHALAVVDGRTAKLETPGDIVSAAAAGEGWALESVRLFLVMLARLAGDLALAYAAEGGVYVCGGVVPKMLGLVDEGAFRAAFEDKAPHDGLMRAMATTIVTSPVSGLLGCAAEATRLLARSAEKSPLSLTND